MFYCINVLLVVRHLIFKILMRSQNQYINNCIFNDNLIKITIYLKRDMNNQNKYYYCINDDSVLPDSE